ncbi:MAG TPA: hypothetical protein EYN34_01520 [Aquifex sp.]|nr:hypothetical protein [Aquifex sp.]
MKRLLLLTLFPLLVFAHRVDVYAEYYGGKIDVFGYFPDGTPAKNADVKLYSPDGKLLFEGKTDKSGRIEIPPPKGVGEVKIVLYAGLGHKAETTLVLPNNQTAKSGETETSTQSETEKTTPQKGEGNQSQPQRSENPPPPHLKREFTWREVFCGFGWILGIFGLLAFVKCRKTKSG